MGNSFSNKKFQIANIYEALIDGKTEEISQIMIDPELRQLLNDNLYKKNNRGRTILHLVIIPFYKTKLKGLSLWRKRNNCSIDQGI